MYKLKRLHWKWRKMLKYIDKSQVDLNDDVLRDYLWYQHKLTVLGRKCGYEKYIDTVDFVLFSDNFSNLLKISNE